MTDSIKFALLGPLQATRSGDPLDLGPRRQCALLSVLLCRANQVVPTDALLRGVWDDEFPPSGARLISTYVYRLRRVLGAAGTPEIERTRGGYLLRLDSGDLDTVRFGAAVDEAKEHSAAGRPEQARACLDTALELWRGDPFAGLPGPLLAAERLRLGEQRLAALEHRAELSLRCGEGDLGAAELRSLRVQHPLRERLAALLMIALYRGGRQAEALAVYTETDGRLREELGVQSGHELASVHQAVLRGDDAALGDLGAPAERRREAVAADTRRRDDLPAGPAHFVGRTRELEALAARRRRPRTSANVTVVDGMPGVGKTAFVLEVAARLRNRHPGGRFHLDLRAHRPGRTAMHPDEALRRLLTAAGHCAADLPDCVEERAALWRHTAAERGVLLVLDDAECTEQVRPLLPSAPNCTVLVAGRRSLPALPAGAALSLAPLDEAAATSLLTHGAGGDRVAREPDAVARLVKACDGSPALLTAIAGRMRHRGTLTFAAMAERVAAPGGLMRITPADARGLDSLLDPSWLRLTVAEQCALRDLAGHGDAAAAPPRPAVLDSLAEANLVEDTATGGYRLHPLVEAYVSEQFTPRSATVPVTG
ncbi:AfsR/SARP family transcriptional regulator [Amycolatopsis antarctica]|uniref:AfsR/SARP family transcriptional regulator n=1 Tax=Amycolatopsis antarctica TaxID=1854586 RepID=UPI0013FE347E|nr:BTAD domain-containing putative transcriptional regulator [Amycolatopsis antarctica]